MPQNNRITFIALLGLLLAVGAGRSAHAQEATPWQVSEPVAVEQPRAPELSADNVPETEARRALAPSTGVVVDASTVEIAVEASRDARVRGAVIGGGIAALLAQKGGRSITKTSVLAAIGAGIGESVAVAAAGRQARAQQLIVRLSNGKHVAVVQEISVRPLAIGEAVIVIVGPKTTRVARQHAGEVRTPEGFATY